ncbi:hypothetical protein ILUMI_22633 [Ignelater luminosus]|uniref:Fucosyltransferase n=1 Tax=Ignelater luminosus TaxID=2038154 RepID=A0A8K0CAC1_IGNLU|nr:hypothetical protein ILUMI_22633 [Ignelater luminosus]
MLCIKTKPHKRKTFLIVFIFSVFSTAIMYIYLQKGHKYVCEIFTKSFEHHLQGDEYYKHGKWRNLSKQQIAKFSELGKILFLDKEYPQINTSAKNYTILVWKHGPEVHGRHIARYTNRSFDPFEDCSVKNCIVTYKDEDLEIADLVLFQMLFMVGPYELPQTKRNPNQIWTFVTEESPLHSFLYFTRYQRYPCFDGFFNWSMTYRMDSDIPMPYGRTIALKKEEKHKKFNFEEWNKSKRQDVLLVNVNSFCRAANSRWEYIDQLQKYITVHRYGACGQYKCPGYVAKECLAASRYKFYLAFENSNCDEYITEKLWWNSFETRSVPIIMGTTPEILNQILPSHSYIHVNDYVNPKDLADYISHLNNTPNKLEKYLEWRNDFKTINEHGYFQSKPVHYCRVCEALNYNNKKKKVYDDLNKSWFKNQCQKGWSTLFGLNVLLK